MKALQKINSIFAGVRRANLAGLRWVAGLPVRAWTKWLWPWLKQNKKKILWTAVGLAIVVAAGGLTLVFIPGVLVALKTVLSLPGRLWAARRSSQWVTVEPLPVAEQIPAEPVPNGRY